jgi:hypothetical protein
MPRPLSHLALTCLLASAIGEAGAQGIYTCVDAKGRRMTSDRPIPECADREQKELNPTGTVRRIVPPAHTPAERAAQEERDRKAAEERQRVAEEKRLQKLLVARYPNQQIHEAERGKALRAVDDAIASGQRRLIELGEQRKALQAETEFYKSAAQWPAKLKRQIDENEQQISAQQRFIAAQEEEKKRITRRYDEELARLRQLWSQHGSTAAAGAPGATSTR